MTIQEILVAHERTLSFITARQICKCGWATNDMPDAYLKHYAHVAEVLEKRMQEREAAVIVGLAELMEECETAHGIAECAAHVEGESGRQAVIDNWESIIEEPAEWLREQANLHHERGFDYLRYVAYEAWQAGYDAGEICASGALDKDHECETNPYADEEPTNGR
ncbi:hypothetical protein ACT3UQ_08940 [Glutamicibacter sp. AOP12-B1-11]|uniref:hypothetical protein n=1 Tax=Glutamicibacter sp. AOP12-B1-11 TaxID=3457725 RepID=UPI0040334F58